MCTFRLTEDERAFMKEALNKYRNSSADETPAKQPSNDNLQVQQLNSPHEDQGASLLAHLEDLFKQQYRWLLEFFQVSIYLSLEEAGDTGL